jgi:uncharacterized protein YijF (DUF1287 family)
MRSAAASVLAAVMAAAGSARADGIGARRAAWVDAFVSGYQPNGRARSLDARRCKSVLEKARSLVGSGIDYDSRYFPIRFPLGDIPSGKGVCADVIVRAFRAASLDLQALVHRDMTAGFGGYPRIWKLRKPDASIDHRRVPNLMVYFARHSSVLPLSRDASAYAPCDVVAWDLGGGVTHIGLVSDASIEGRAAIIHHISGQPAEEEVLFAWRLIGHFAF